MSYLEELGDCIIDCEEGDVVGMLERTPFACHVAASPKIAKPLAV